MSVKQDHAGKRFGQIVLDAPVPGRPGYWKGTCGCGNQQVVKRLDNLKRPGRHSCGTCRQQQSFTATDTPAALATLVAEVASLREELALVKEGLARSSAQMPGNIKTAEAREIWSYIDEMRVWLKTEIGARLKALDDKTVVLTDAVEKLQQDAPISAGRPTQIQTWTPAVASGPTQGVLGDPIVVAANGKAKQTETPLDPAQRPQGQRSLKRFPVSPTHLYHKRFFYRETEEGYELNTTLGEKEECLGFFDTVPEMREAIEDHLYEQGSLPHAFEGLFPEPAVN